MGLVPIRINTLPSITNLPIVIAAQKGIFEAHGLDATVNSSTDVAADHAALGKQIDFAGSNASIYLPSQAQGLDNVIVTNLGSGDLEGSVALTIAAKEEITDFATLKGKTIGLPLLRGGNFTAISYVLGNAGLEPDDYRLVEIPYAQQLDNLESGNVDAAMTALPFLVQLQDAGYWVSDSSLDVVAANEISGGVTKEVSNAFLVANREWALANPDTVDAYAAAIAEAIEWLHDNEAEARDLLAEWTGMEKEVAEKAPLLRNTAKIDRTQFQSIWDLLVYVDSVEGDLPEDKIHIWQDIKP